MRITLTILALLCSLPALPWEFTGDESRKPEIQKTLAGLETYGFPMPDTVSLEDQALKLTAEGRTLGVPVRDAKVDLAWALVDLELAALDANAFQPWRDATSAFLRSAIHERPWTPSSLQGGLIKAFIEDLAKDDKSLLGTLWSESRGLSWGAWDAFFQFHFGQTAEAFFESSAARALPYARPLMPKTIPVELKGTEVNFILPPAAPLTVALVELAFPADRLAGAAFTWDALKFPVPAVLLAYYGPPLDTFEMVDLTQKEKEIAVPFKGLSGLYVAAFSPDFSKRGEPALLHAFPLENFPFQLKAAGLAQDEEGVSISFDAEALQQVESFVILKGNQGEKASPQPVGTVPGLGTSPETFSFTIVDSDIPQEGQRPVYYLYALTEDGLLAQAASLPLAAQAGSQ